MYSSNPLKSSIDPEKMKALKGLINKAEEVQIKEFSENLGKEYFNTEVLRLALDTGNHRIIEHIIDKTSKEIIAEVFSNFESIKSIFDTKNIDLIECIIGHIPQNIFEKHSKQIIEASFEIKDVTLITNILDKVPKEYLNTDLLSKILSLLKNAEFTPSSDNLKTPDIAESNVLLILKVMDTFPESIMSNLDKQFYKISLGKTGIINLTKQILSGGDNIYSFQIAKLYFLLDIYKEVINNYFTEGKIPENFPIGDFNDSMEACKKLVNPFNNISLQGLNNNNKFMIAAFCVGENSAQPDGHMIYTLIQKTKNNSKDYDVTLVNLGSRPSLCESDNDYRDYSYRTYLMNEENLQKLMRYKKESLHIDSFYKEISSLAIKDYPLNVYSHEQKVGNCLVHNMRKALDLAINKSLTADLDKKDLETKNIDVNTAYKNKLIRPLHLLKETTTHEITTLEVKEALVRAIIKRYPEYKKELAYELTLYKMKKSTNPKRMPDRFSRSSFRSINM